MTSIPEDVKTELKPCPMCGAAPSMHGAFDVGYRIICRHDGQITGECSVSANTLEDAVALWNRRAILTDREARSVIPAGDGEAELVECLAAGKPFVFDPATNFLHADDGTVEGGIRYLPAPETHSMLGGMTDAEIEQWIEACNHKPARETLRHYLSLRSPSPETLLQAEPDYCYDPDEWEFTCHWADRDEVHGHGDALEFDEPMRVCTLVDGPDKWVAAVPVEWDEVGDVIDTEVKWFDTEAEARAALATEGKDNE